MYLLRKLAHGSRRAPQSRPSPSRVYPRGPNPLGLWGSHPSRVKLTLPQASNMSTTSKQPKHLLTMIPGPIEFDDSVLDAMSHPSIAHTAGPFVETFSAVLKQLRTIFFAKDPEAQPFVIAGGGMLGWDLSAANLVAENEKVLVLSTGFFSDSWAKCFEVYKADVTVLKADIGDVTPLDKIKTALESAKYKAITITQVDTSTAVLQDVKAISELVKKVSPETLIFVDGVCSIGCEELRFDDWGIDYALTAPQKALGTPSGLSISVASKRALAGMDKIEPRGYYTDLRKWLPIMRSYESGKPAYFSTPAIQNIYALHESLNLIAKTEKDIYDRFKAHADASNKFKDALEAAGAKLLAKRREIAAHGLTAAYLPDGVELPSLTKYMLDHNVVIAGGILPPIAAKYFRVGHMGVSVTKYGYIDRVEKDITAALKELSK